MGRGRRFVAHFLHVDKSPPPSAIAGLIGATQSLTQPVLHQTSPDHQEPRIDHIRHETPVSSRPVSVLGSPTATCGIAADNTPLQAPTQQQHQPSRDRQHHDDSTNRDPSIWARAFRHFMESRPELAAYYARHLESLGEDKSATTRSAEGTHAEAVAPAPTTTLQKIDLIVKKLHDHREQRQWKVPLAGKDIKIREQAEKLAKFLLWSDPIVKDALSAQPYAALAWSGVSFLLSLLTTGTSQHASMLHGFEIVNDTLVYWHICEDTYLSPAAADSKSPSPAPLPEHASLSTSLTRLYSLLIEYQALAIAHLSRSQVTRALEKVMAGNEWVDRITQIEAENERCRKMIDPIKERQIQDRAEDAFKAMLESKEILNGIKEALEESKSMVQRNYEDQLERNLLHDLAGDYEGFKNLGNPRRVEGTCEWFFRDKDFRQWRDGEQGVLWVTAGPGCGKSVLARALVDEGRLATRVTTTAVAHFFFKKGDGRRMKASSALAALVHQLLTQNAGTRGSMDDALRRHRSHGVALATNFSELWGALVHYVGSSDAPEAVCVLDALDECDEEDREMLMEQIRGFYRNKTANAQAGKLKFLITSRPHDGIQVALRKLSSVGALFHVDGDGLSREIGDEINLVIDDKLSSIMAGFTERDRSRISDKLKSMKQRTYLWLHLTLDIIRKTPSRFCRPRDLETFLAKLPSAVSDAYEQILGSSTDRHQTQTLLEIVVAARQPLTLDEANIALTLALADNMPASIDDLDPWPRDAFKGVVQNLCGTFVTVSDGHLSLIHQTARDFLLDPSRNRKDEGWKGCLSLAQAHSTMSRSCMHYLGLLAEHTSANSHVYLDPEKYRCLQSEQPFLAYAAAYWPTHYLVSDPTTRSKNSPELSLSNNALTLCRPVAAHVWAPQHFSRGTFLCWWTWTDVALASYVGLARVVEQILSCENINVNSRCSDFGTPLQTAVAGGHESVVHVLLEGGAVVDLDGNSDKKGSKGHGTALRIAAARGYKQIVKLLLGRGADPQLGVRGSGRGTAVEAAEAGGHGDVVEILRQAAATEPHTVERQLENPDDVDEAGSPLFPRWFDHDDLDDEPPRAGVQHRESAYEPWGDGDSVYHLNGSPAARGSPSGVSLLVPKRATAFQYMLDANDSCGVLNTMDEKQLEGGIMSDPWLRL
ncbi:hypothetical protein OQA88_1186 [Cercophora sp. LCS_1]